jgi:hypothetical protein
MRNASNRVNSYYLPPDWPSDWGRAHSDPDRRGHTSLQCTTLGPKAYEAHCLIISVDKQASEARGGLWFTWPAFGQVGPECLNGWFSTRNRPGSMRSIQPKLEADHNKGFVRTWLRQWASSPPIPMMLPISSTLWWPKTSSYLCISLIHTQCKSLVSHGRHYVYVILL